MTTIYLLWNTSSIMPSTEMFDYDRPPSIAQAGVALYMMKKNQIFHRKIQVCDIHKVGLCMSIYGNIKILESVSLIKG